MSEYNDLSDRMRRYFNSGVTKPKEFRVEQLRKLKNAILENEQNIFAALYADLGKPQEEAWVTELGIVLTEIRQGIQNLGKWMRPTRVRTNLLNFPSSSYIYKEPRGIVLVIGPWNYPFQLLLTPLAGAIAAGNAVVLKPSELAPATSALVTGMIKSIYPPDYISCIEGEGPKVVPSLIDSFQLDHIFFTGSEQVGRQIYRQAADKLVPVTLELGGKTPCVVESDANIKVAAKRIALTKFSNAGQMCVAPDYLLVHDTVYDRFVEQLKIFVEKFYSEENNPGGYGKMIHQNALERVAGYLKQGKILAGGEVDHKNRTIGPTLIEDVDRDAGIMKEEIFGPVLPILRFSKFEEAKSIVQENPEPLAFYVFTESKEKESRWLKEIAFGGGCINNAAWQLTNPYLPFGGRGKSGIGAYHGKHSFELFSHRKSVMKTPTWFDPSIKYPPFKGKLGLFKKLTR
jgi:aldehyde dehydrogenase (NAD+)